MPSGDPEDVGSGFGHLWGPAGSLLDLGGVTMKITKKTSMMGMLFLIAVVIGLIIAGPLLVIWSLNTLFPALAIPYTIWTWLAALILGSAVAPKITKRD